MNVKSMKRKAGFLSLLLLLMVTIPILAVGKGKPDAAQVFNSKQSGALMGNVKNKDADGDFFCCMDAATNEVLKVPDREFVYGIVAAEMPVNFDIEALKAQAVASYTYCCRARKAHREKEQSSLPSEFVDGSFIISAERGFVYINKDEVRRRWGEKFDENYKKLTEAVDDVFGDVIKDEGNLIFAAYHAMSSGVTEKNADVFGSDFKYLTNVESPGDKLVQNYKTKVEVESSSFKSVASNEWNDCSFGNDPAGWIGSPVRTQGGMVKEIDIASHKAKGRELRKMFALRSSNFDVNYDRERDKFVFTVRGYGHGVGMSQHGANYMAKEGNNYKQILQWYYPGTEISKLN